MYSWVPQTKNALSVNVPPQDQIPIYFYAHVFPFQNSLPAHQVSQQTGMVILLVLLSPIKKPLLLQSHPLQSPTVLHHYQTVGIIRLVPPLVHVLLVDWILVWSTTCYLFQTTTVEVVLNVLGIVWLLMLKVSLHSTGRKIVESVAVFRRLPTYFKAMSCCWSYFIGFQVILMWENAPPNEYA